MTSVPRRQLLACAAAAAWLPRAAAAEGTWPTRAVRIVVPFAPPTSSPADIVNRIQRETARAFESPAFKERLVSQGTIPGGQPPAEFAKFIAAETRKRAQVVKVSGAKVD